MLRRLAFTGVFAACTAVTPIAGAEEPKHAPDLVAVADPDFGMESSVRTFMSLGRVFRRYEEIFPEVFRNTGLPLLPVLERIARFGLLDAPFADMQMIVIHEVAGHGARGREIGKSPTFSFKLPEPYRTLFSPDDEEKNFTRRRDTGTRNVDGDLPIVLGGVESNYLTAHWTNLALVASAGQLHFMDRMVYMLSKTTYASSFLGENLATASLSGGDDIIAYAAQLAERFNQFTPAERRQVATRVQTAYVWNLVDPTLMWSFWTTIYDGFGRGKRVSTMPLPVVRGHHVFLSPRFTLSPFGAEHYVDLFAGKAPWVADVYFRFGTSGLATYLGAGTKVLDVPVGSRVRAGGEIDAWTQPVIDRSARAFYDRPNSAGVNVAAIGSVAIVGPLSITGKLGYKSNGFVMGLPIGDGPHGYLGIALRP